MRAWNILLAHARGPYDIIMAWDGCQRKSRRVLEDSVGQLHTCAEVFMVYTKSWNHWAAQKVFLGSENTECGYINTPLGRTKKFIKNRGGGASTRPAKRHRIMYLSRGSCPLLGCRWRASLRRTNSRSSRTRRPTCPALGPIKRPVSRCSGLKKKCCDVVHASDRVEREVLRRPHAGQRLVGTSMHGKVCRVHGLGAQQRPLPVVDKLRGQGCVAGD